MKVEWAEVKGYIVVSNESLKLEKVKHLLEMGVISNIGYADKCISQVDKQEKWMRNSDFVNQSVIEFLIWKTNQMAVKMRFHLEWKKYYKYDIDKYEIDNKW